MSDIPEAALQLIMLISAIMGMVVIDLNRTVRQTVAPPVVVVVVVQRALKARPIRQRRKSCC
jgi:hypothetical protein